MYLVNKSTKMMKTLNQPKLELKLEWNGIIEEFLCHLLLRLENFLSEMN